MTSLTELETRAVLSERLREAGRRRGHGVHPRHRYFGPSRRISRA